jgi:hypothetical protein
MIAAVQTHSLITFQFEVHCSETSIRRFRPGWGEGVLKKNNEHGKTIDAGGLSKIRFVQDQRNSTIDPGIIVEVFLYIARLIFGSFVVSELI